MSGWIEHAFGAGKDFVEQPDPAHSFIMITCKCLSQAISLRLQYSFSCGIQSDISVNVGVIGRNQQGAMGFWSGLNDFL
ncbi:hypothetical protein [Mesorhizobium sp.]|uniref:hypothetical protein n=1 Tax=Mesorhizobium sp. TaxID=1871066 RepID=UPI000FEA8ADA|nr:hypothetical protein [Mesorhizobium sp.]RWP04197.1 MAG: hypothetical protein EOQ99_20235 [Mesorhizobium sp.]RWP29159.1 MAG: hypothetical protein EOR02_16860 [Mesorhizobium sp.]